MARKKYVYILSFVLIYFMTGIYLWSIENQVNSESVTINQILDNYKTKCGGDALGNILTEIKTGFLTRGEAGSVPFEARLKAPGKLLYNQVFAFGDQVSYGFDGHDAWLQSMDNVSILPESILLDLQLIFDISAPMKMREYFPDMKLKGVKKQSDGDIAMIEAVSTNGLKRELVFDLTTGLLKKAGDIYFEDYRQTGKVMRPYRIFIGDDLGDDHPRMKMEFTNIQESTDIDDAVFLKPPAPLRKSSFSILKNKKEIPVSINILESLTGTYRRIDKPEITYTIYLQDGHLMFQRYNAPISVEIRPESESDFFVRFPTTEYHFINEADKKVLEIEAGSQRVKAEKIK
jgi:hypothetical protein